ncbi:MAG: stage II sporulation protein M [Caulobacteraceae bacterium]|nr:stage II sporulation protein M [Caulobacter sp.]
METKLSLHLERFVAAERPYWDELENRLDALDGHGSRDGGLDLAAAERLHYLYGRAAGDLARLDTFSAERDLRRNLGALVARAYAEIHSQTGRTQPPDWRAPWRWLAGTFPRTFRRHAAAFWLAVAVTLVGAGFGALAAGIDPEAKSVILPFGHADITPGERVAEEQENKGEYLAGHKASFSGQLMANNIKVGVTALALGATWAVGTLVVVFYNGVILGALCLDYLRAGQGVFLAGWLLPHGSIEIPAIVVAGQAGFVLGGAMIGWGRRVGLRGRLAAIRADLVTLIGGVALMLVWAGIVEAFFSQYHEPVLPYWLKIVFGSAELVCLTLYLALAGRQR